MGKIRLRTMFLVLLAALFIAAVVTNYYWTSYSLHKKTERELAEKGQVLSQQMDAVWSFMSANQDQLEKIAYTESGSYKGLHCAIVGRSIGMLFSQQTNYTTRFVNFSPRNPSDWPDDFEKRALEAFLADPSVKEYYEFTTFNNMEVFRYSAPMNIEQNCLECHGEPVGEVDVTGFPKEGWRIGDVGGAISIVIPLDIYMESENSTVVDNLLFFGALLLVFVVCIWFALSYLVTSPLNRIKTGVKQMQKGDLDIQLSAMKSSREVFDLVQEFNAMSNELATIYNDLENQVSDRTEQLSAVNTLLEAQRAQLEDINNRLTDENRYKSDFLAMMSHELRTPLTSIIAFADLLKKSTAPQPGTASETDADVNSISKEIEANSQLLLTIINNILDMSRIDAGKAELNLEVVDFGDLVASVDTFIKPLATQRGIEVSFKVENNVPLAYADFDKLHHIFINLLSNALKFTPPKGEVGVSVSYDAQADEVLLEVSDSGIGIALEKQKEIFERFRQIEPSISRTYNGTGLGLALVKEYSEMHGGTVAVQSELGQGSVFTIRIPVRDLEGDGR